LLGIVKAFGPLAKPASGATDGGGVGWGLIMLREGPMIDAHRVTLASEDDFDGWRDAARDQRRKFVDDLKRVRDRAAELAR